VRSDSTFARRARSIPVEHLAAEAARQPHEIAFPAAAGEPAVGEGMPQLVRVDPIAESSLPSALPDDLGDSAVGQPALPTHP
jgi:hypothetical protein